MSIYTNTNTYIYIQDSKQHNTQLQWRIIWTAVFFLCEFIYIYETTCMLMNEMFKENKPVISHMVLDSCKLSHLR